MEYIIKQKDFKYFFYHDQNQLAVSYYNFLTSSSTAEIYGLGNIKSKASGFFAFYRFEIFINTKLMYSFKKSVWGKLKDSHNEVELWKGEIIVDGYTVGEFSRSSENLIKPLFNLRLNSKSLLPLAICYLPYAVANRHL